MSGFIYFIQANGAGPIKIGFTAGNPCRRMVKIQSDCPWPVSLLGAVPGSLDDEAAFHARLSDHVTQGEWFAANDTVLAEVRAALASDNCWKPARRRAKHNHPLCEYRSERGLTLYDVAASTGLSHATLSRIESGAARPGLVALKAIYDATGIPKRHLRPDLAELLNESAQIGNH